MITCRRWSCFVSCGSIYRRGASSFCWGTSGARRFRPPEGASTLSIEQRVPIIPFSGWRERAWVHRMRFEAPLYLSSSFTRATRTEATNVLNRFMERVIRERPEQWFYWFNAEERWETEQGDGAGAHTEQERGKTHTA
ncbi:LpxL/LpxP family acyltransferase [Paenibacillus oleatilyticus]|uniref:LpxL/LpxP family acyltransferase n=1 Tax=Paenibacillus oleatilyticus TaxID=2594886 RepID=UPI0020A6E5FA|nr:hypothetical protein [Paenibacillus oleatilyticus]